MFELVVGVEKIGEGDKEELEVSMRLRWMIPLSNLSCITGDEH